MHCLTAYFPAIRRYEAAGWLRKMVGVVASRDLPNEPTEEEFLLGLRSGSIICNALNKVHPGAVSKVWNVWWKLVIQKDVKPPSKSIFVPCVLKFIFFLTFLCVGGRDSGWFSPFAGRGSFNSISIFWECQELPGFHWRIGASCIWGMWSRKGMLLVDAD